MHASEAAAATSHLGQGHGLLTFTNSSSNNNGSPTGTLGLVHNNIDNKPISGCHRRMGQPPANQHARIR